LALIDHGQGQVSVFAGQ